MGDAKVMTECKVCGEDTKYNVGSGGLCPHCARVIKVLEYVRVHGVPYFLLRAETELSEGG